MLIDPFTIIAQVVNFAILVVALKYVLYDRIIDAMNAREAAIAGRLDEAEERERQADEARREHREQIDDLEHRRGQLLDEARSEADDRRNELLRTARRNIDEQRRRWHSALRRERDDIERELRTSTANAALAVSRRVLRDVADADLAHRALELALDRLDDDGELRELIDANDGSALTVSTAFDGDSTRALVRDRLDAMGLTGGEQVSFETDRTLLLGIEVTSPTASIQWSGRDYLDQLGTVVDDLLDDARADDGRVDNERGGGRPRSRADEQVHADAG